MVPFSSSISAHDLVILAGKTLIISDIHIGYEESLNRQGILVPRVFFKETMKRLAKSIDAIKNTEIKNKKPEHKKFDAVILNGDLKDEFGRISETEWRHALRFFDYLATITKRIVIVKGNHDVAIGPLARKRNIELADFYFFEIKRPPLKDIHYKKFKNNSIEPLKILVIHGDSLPSKSCLKKADLIIIGHVHPAVQIRDAVRAETFKCYLVGRFRNKTLIVQPSANVATEGSNVLQERSKSPFLTDAFLRSCDVYIVGDKIYPFGKLRRLQ